ncbi:MAG TPA: SoxR reducing system RseC family protein [Dysgonamonadaceae bacterium]|jgi:sigma-E factor negative regulatory protein RseC|nr:SoxR reducing system RseC family protein [Dysgonamonadaceae bacterium]
MIEHEGTIRKIDGNQLTILISQNSACSECHAKGACMAADTKEKMVDVVDDTGMYRLNERVMLLGKTSIGYKAILWAFVIPLILMIGVIVASTSIWDIGELQAAFMSIIVLAPYYAFLYMVRAKMGERLAFTIKKLN